MMFKEIASLAIIIGLASPALAAPREMMPPTCRGEVCKVYGRGGYQEDWESFIRTQALYGKSFVVPANKPCYSACVVAVGLALTMNLDIEISPKADIMWGHEPDRLKKFPMPKWFRDRALSK